MSKCKSKVCFITPNLNMGGMERVLSVLANYAAEKYFSIYIICLIDDKVYYPINSRVTIVTPDFNYKKGVVNKQKTAIYLLNSLKTINPDSILSFSEAFNPLSIVIAKIAGFPIFISDRSSPEIQLKPTTQLLRKLTYPLANGLILQTELAREIAEEKKYNNNLAVIPNPLKEITEYPTTIRKNVIISVGRLIPSKNFSELIDIFNNIKYKDSWELWILGDGPDKVSLQEKINKMSLSDKVKLLGAVKDVDKYLSKASIFAFTSLSEGFPNVLSEALANALPCIAYDCISGPADLIQHGENGFLVPLKNQVKFRYYLSQLIESSELRQKMAKNHVKHREKYKVEHIAKLYLSFILT